MTKREKTQWVCVIVTVVSAIALLLNPLYIRDNNWAGFAVACGLAFAIIASGGVALACELSMIREIKRKRKNDDD